MFRFEHPSYLYLLLMLALYAVLHYYAQHRQERKIRRFGDPLLVKQLLIDVSRPRQEIKFWLAQLALASLIVALARPQYGTKVETSERQGIECIIALDVSNSMLAEDVKPSRMAKAKRLISTMVDEMRDDKVGFIVYAGQAFNQLPITSDYVSAKMFLETIDPSMISVQGTDIAEAINLGRKSFTQQEDVSRALFVITDGEDNEGRAVEAAKAAAQEGIRVYMLGVGNPNGAPIPIPGTGRYIVDEEGNTVVSKLNEEMCRQIAQAGQGAYIYVDNSSSAQEQLSAQIDKLAKAKLETQVYSEYDEQYQGFVILALFFLLADACILTRQSHKWSLAKLFKK